MLKLQPSTFAEFEREAERGNVVPVVRSVLADLQTPVAAFIMIAHDAPYAFLLESIEGGERLARYSFLGTNPWMIVRGRGAQTVIERNGAAETRENQNAVEFVREYFSNQKLARRSGLAPLTGGAVGYLAYDAAHWFEPVLEVDGERDGACDDAVWMFYRTVLAFDRVRQQVEITSVVFTDESEGNRSHLRDLYENAVAETERLEGLLVGGISTSPPPAGSLAGGNFTSSWRRKDFERAVGSVKEYIAAGDCYQAVLSQQFTKQTNADPLTVYRALRATNPAPYMYFLRLGQETIIGASPEMLVRCHGQRLDYRPIAGTRKRGATETEDWMLGEEMCSDEKEVAEHTMLVDLGRNDLGRVSDYGSVQVEQLMNIERYSQVQHLVTSLRSRLRDGLDRFDALASCFPAGTVTGAPKIRAMEIIRELEPVRRGVYAGSILYADYADNLDSCIAIRTIVMRDGKASVQAGAGIVADSVPEREYEETMNKAQALFRAVELAEGGL